MRLLRVWKFLITNIRGPLRLRATDHNHSVCPRDTFQWIRCEKEEGMEETWRRDRQRSISRSGTRHFNTKWRHLKLYLYWIEIHATRLSRFSTLHCWFLILEHSSGELWASGALGLWASAQAQHVAKPIIILVWQCNKRMNKWTRRSESGTPKQFSFHRLSSCSPFQRIVCSFLSLSPADKQQRVASYQLPI